MILVPAFAVFYHAAGSSDLASKYLQAGMTLVAFGLVIWSYRSNWARSRSAGLLLGLAFLITAWAGLLTHINGFDVNYAVGFFLTSVSAAMFLSLAYDEMTALSAYTAYAVIVTLLLLGFTTDPGVNPVIFIASMLVALALVHVAVSARIQVQDALEEREAHLAEAQRTAGLGNWELNIRNDRAVWSPEMYYLIGLDPEHDLPSFDILIAHVLPADRPALFRFWDTLKAGRQHEDVKFRLDAGDDTIRVIRMKGVHSPGTASKAERLSGICIDATEEDERERVLMDAKDQAEHAREQAENAREQAEEMARMKSAFVANMSHEIRTPLTAIIGFAQVLSEELGEQKRDLIEPIEQSGKRLLSTLNSVLDFARFKSEGATVQVKRVDVAEEVHELAEMLRPLASDKGLSLLINAPVMGVFALADKSALHRVITNLVSNAIKFTDKGRITISVEETAAEVYVRVRDTGRGIGPQFLPRLFEEFHQESTGVQRSHEGSGLGLAITKGLVDMMNGEIEVDSAVDEGTVFTMTLPVAPAPPPQSAISEATIIPAEQG